MPRVDYPEIVMMFVTASGPAKIPQRSQASKIFRWDLGWSLNQVFSVAEFEFHAAKFVLTTNLL
jgi:hypothetical protein